jgi:hypothetical protein
VRIRAPDLVERFNPLGVCASHASVTGALAELALGLELRVWAPARTRNRMDPGALEPKSTPRSITKKATKFCAATAVSMAAAAVLLDLEPISRAGVSGGAKLKRSRRSNDPTRGILSRKRRRSACRRERRRVLEHGVLFSGVVATRAVARRWTPRETFLPSHSRP